MDFRNVPDNQRAKIVAELEQHADYYRRFLVWMSDNAWIDLDPARNSVYAIYHSIVSARQLIGATKYDPQPPVKSGERGAATEVKGMEWLRLHRPMPGELGPFFEEEVNPQETSEPKD